MKRDLTQELVEVMAAVSVSAVHTALGEDAQKVKSDFVAEGRDVGDYAQAAQQIEACAK